MCSESPATQSHVYQCMMDIWISQLCSQHKNNRKEGRERGVKTKSIKELIKFVTVLLPLSRQPWRSAFVTLWFICDCTRLLHIISVISLALTHTLPSLTLCGSPSVASPPCSSSTDHGVAGTVNTYKQPITITIFIPFRQT